MAASSVSTGAFVTPPRHGAAPPGLGTASAPDPIRAPEHIALAAADVRPAGRPGPDKRRAYAVAPAELAKMAKKRHATLARFEGAATGVGGIVTMVPDLVGARLDPVAAGLLRRRRLRLRPARPDAAGRGARPVRVLRPDPGDARRALDGIGSTVVEAYIGSKLQREEALALRLAKFVGIRSARKLAGRLIPGVAIAFNSVGNERRTRALADRAIRFYGG